MPKKKKEEEKVKDSLNRDEIMKDLMAYVDTSLDERLEKVVDQHLKKEVMDEIDKAHKKIIREKNRKIFVKNIFLVLFFAIIVFLVYLLYKDHYFDSYLNRNYDVKTEERASEGEDHLLLEEVPTVTFEDLKEEYASYLDPYVLMDGSSYIEDFYTGNLQPELLNYFSLAALDFEKVAKEDDYQMIDPSDLESMCTILFTEKCKKTNFDFNGNKVRYFEKLDAYVTDNMLERKESSIQREIIDIQEDGSKVVITTVEGILFDNQLYSVYPSEYIEDYNGEGLVSYQEQLNKVIYTFKDKKLVSIEKG